MGISERGFKVTVPEELPDHGQVNPAHYQTACVGVAQVVKTEVLQPRLNKGGPPFVLKALMVVPEPIPEDERRMVQGAR